MPTSGHEAGALGDEPAHVVDRDRRRPRRQVVVRDVVARQSARDAGGPALPRGGVGDLGGLAAVVADVRDEVLQDHLLQMSVIGVDGGERLERGDALVLALADADEDPARERDPQLAGGTNRLQPALRVLRRATPDGRRDRG